MSFSQFDLECGTSNIKVKQIKAIQVCTPDLRVNTVNGAPYDASQLISTDGSTFASCETGSFTISYISDGPDLLLEVNGSGVSMPNGGTVRGMPIAATVFSNTDPSDTTPGSMGPQSLLYNGTEDVATLGSLVVQPNSFVNGSVWKLEISGIFELVPALQSCKFKITGTDGVTTYTLYDTSIFSILSGQSLFTLSGLIFVSAASGNFSGRCVTTVQNNAFSNILAFQSGFIPVDSPYKLAVTIEFTTFDGSNSFVPDGVVFSRLI